MIFNNIILNIINKKNKMSTNIYLQDYTENSFVILGDTKKYKETIKKMGGKWNSNLTNKKTNEKFGGWLFWSKKRPEIKKWVSNGCTEIRMSIDDIEKQIVFLESELKRLRMLSSKKSSTKISEEPYDIFDDEEEETSQSRRLLK